MLIEYRGNYQTGDSAKFFIVAVSIIVGTILLITGNVLKNEIIFWTGIAWDIGTILGLAFGFRSR